ncbi:MAG: SpoIIE family protein phosphatase [Acidobacteria bacterium]|nr:SpoIIE family protein phosphatase [Acidobacteriota bacterium]
MCRHGPLARAAGSKTRRYTSRTGAAAIATATARKRDGPKDYVASFAGVVARFTAPHTTDEILATVPSTLVAEFEAARAELWLWDESSRSACLTHAAGGEAAHRQDCARRGEGAIGKVAEARTTIQSAPLSRFGADDAEFARRTGFTHLSAFPLMVRERLLGVLAIYTAKQAGEELLKWWDVYAEVSSVAVHEALSAQESRKTITQLSLLFDATRLLNSTLDLGELLDLILKIARTEVKADRGTVFLVDRKQNEIWSIVASGLDREEIRVALGHGVAGRVAETGETINVADAYTLPYHERSFDQRFGYRTTSLLCMPIRHHNQDIVGVIQLLNKAGGALFTKDDEDFLNKLSGHMAMALENARLHRDALEKQRMERDLALARTIQRGLLPEEPPVLPGFDLAVSNEPCFECGGDYYDFLNLGPQTMLLVVADVEGKGVSSALVMSNLQASLRALVNHLHSLEVLTLSLNEMIYHDTKSKKFLSIFLGLVDTRGRGLHYINAGHVPPILVRAESGAYQQLEEGGLVIGLFPHAEYERGSVRLQPGDVLICCTDGILEAENSRQEEYGHERLAATVAHNRHKSAPAIVDAILAEVKAFSRDGQHVDDKVLMIMKVNPDASLATAGSPLERPPY